MFVKLLFFAGFSSFFDVCCFYLFRAGFPPTSVRVSQDIGLLRFLESFRALKKLRRLDLIHHEQITAIPAGISSLQNLEELSFISCPVPSLPNELGALSRLTRLDFGWNRNLGAAPRRRGVPSRARRDEVSARAPPRLRTASASSRRLCASCGLSRSSLRQLRRRVPGRRPVRLPARCLPSSSDGVYDERAVYVVVHGSLARAPRSLAEKLEARDPDADVQF